MCGGGDCFVEGTKIVMGNGKPKNIEMVQLGDRVLTYNVLECRLERQPVLGLMMQLHSGKDDDYTIKIRFDNGVENHNTNTHPYFIKGEGWASWLPELTKERYGLSVKKLEEGQTALYWEGDEVKLWFRQCV